MSLFLSYEIYFCEGKHFHGQFSNIYPCLLNLWNPLTWTERLVSRIQLFLALVGICLPSYLRSNCAVWSIVALPTGPNSLYLWSRVTTICCLYTNDKAFIMWRINNTCCHCINTLLCLLNWTEMSHRVAILFFLVFLNN